MERRSWPWKKKSSVKATTAIDLSSNQGDQEYAKKVSYVEISAETYSHLLDFEDQVKVLKEKLSFAQSEMTNKDNMVKQHAKVAEDAVSGWEKAEAEALALKHRLEAVTLQKLTAENRASHLDGALKECTKQMEILKEESAEILHDTLFTKTKQWEKEKSELEHKMINFEQRLSRSSAESASLSRSLHERSSLLMEISQEKSQADAEIETLKTDIQSRDKELNCLKYEFHVVSKELEIRSEEKNMSIRSAEAGNKQRLEDVRKISKLEADCQRLRGLVRKKLPSNAALAQMKLEVENLGRDHSETRLHSNSKSSSPLARSSPKHAFDNIQQCQKDNEFLTARLLEMEEEIKMQKEALIMSNNELFASRKMSANQLRSIEANKILNQQKSPSKSEVDPSLDGSLSHNKSSQHLVAMFEDGFDEVGSCYESWTTSVISEISPFKKERVEHTGTSNSNHLELMDDFLEMERLACLSAESNARKKQTSVKSTETKDNVLLSKFQSRIASLFESEVVDSNMEKVLEDVRWIVKDTQDGLPHSSSSVKEESLSAKHDLDGLTKAICQIHAFVLSLYSEYIEIKGGPVDDHGLAEKFRKFTGFVDKIPYKEISLDDYIFALSHILSETSMFSRASEADITSIDCIDKVTLLEKRVVQHDAAKERFSGDCIFSSSSRTDREISVGTDIPGYGLKAGSIDECEQLKQQRDNMQIDLGRSNESLKHAKLQLVEMEQYLIELNSQFASCQTSNSLAETRLRCMTESYKTLELHKKELETEINHLRSKAETLDCELQEERRNHQEDLVRLKVLQEKMERNMVCSVCSSHSEADIVKMKQEKEYAAAAEKLAECQKSIVLLSRQLKAMHPQTDVVFNSKGLYQPTEEFLEKEPHQSGCNSPPKESHNVQHSAAESKQNVVAPNKQRATGESHNHSNIPNMVTNPVSRPLTSSKRPKQRSRTASASSLATMLGEKQSRGFSRFFFQKE